MDTAVGQGCHAFAFHYFAFPLPLLRQADSCSINTVNSSRKLNESRRTEAVMQKLFLIISGTSLSNTLLVGCLSIVSTVKEFLSVVLSLLNQQY
jgi:hypothetical protein